MPRHAVPRYLRLIKELPKTPTQRIQKFRLREDGVTMDAVDREALGIYPPRESTARREAGPLFHQTVV